MPQKTKQQAKMANRRRQVASLYLRGHTQQQIADQLDVTQATISKDVNWLLQQWREEHQHETDLRVAKHLEELTAMRREAWDTLPEGKERIEALLKIQDRETKLLGLDSPKRHDIGLALSPEVQAMAQQLGINKADIVREFEALIRSEAERVNSS